MPHVTTIYLASDRPDRFRFLEDRFPKEVTLTRDYTKADLLIIDLSYPGEKWPWLGASANWRVEEAPYSTPFLLVAWDGPEDPALFNTITRIRGSGPMSIAFIGVRKNSGACCGASGPRSPHFAMQIWSMKCGRVVPKWSCRPADEATRG